ncbi:extracellular calcium-sensing receptor-like [Gadus macrocephalus]|uniref:extracellular calcium-sensing receptor-like n=1 Tax=Gadus macrocephalus TaxID=80720 RepID=UPI0028CBB129|nr:extracellular calcium-sensing receptor-like [Gadus macrocephalus]
MGIALTVVSPMGAVLSLSTVSTFLYHRETPVIKFSNFDLSCLLLFSLFLCFLCPLTFIGRPTVWTCILNPRELLFARAVIFTVEEINKNPTLLNGVTLGYRIYNGCGGDGPIRAAIEAVTSGESCSKRVQALIGHSSSGVSKNINLLVGVLDIPLISHLSTCACLSDKRIYPTFFRTVPSDQFQISALVQLMKHFGWQWVGIIHSAEVYASDGAAEFIKQGKVEGICVEYAISFDLYDIKTEQKVTEKLKASTSSVVLLYMSLTYMRALFKKVDTNNLPRKQWIGSEAWISQVDLASIGSKNVLHGAMGFALPQSIIPGLADFLMSLKPSDEPESVMIKVFWESFFDCSFSPSNTTKLCTGGEDLRTISSAYTNTALRSVRNVYTAVYSIAHALNALLQCENGLNPTTGKHCVNNTDVQPKQVLEHLKLVDFTVLNGYKVSFDENGDTAAQYDLLNWQYKEGGSVNVITIGQYDSSLPEEHRFRFIPNTTIVWALNSTEPPKSVCRDACPAGSRKAVNKHAPVCCFDCFECPEGGISNETDSSDCFLCTAEFWPNDKKDKCIPKPTEFLSFPEIMGTILTAFTCFGVFLSILIFIIFLVHKETPIVRANNSELSFLLLLSLKLCFLCSLTFIGRPSEWSCMLRHTAFGITFVLCISCVLGKTIVVLMAFRATLPSSNAMKWFGPTQQRLSVLAFTLIQVVICILWLTINPPFPNRNVRSFKDKIVLECALGSPIGFWAVLGYIGLLALLCFILAFLARKLPDSFNEAKFITFSMVIFCAVWIAFIPAYVSSPGKFTVAVEIFAILASTFGLLICIFVPKCYIIIFKPEQNSKKHIKSKMQSKGM